MDTTYLRKDSNVKKRNQNKLEKMEFRENRKMNKKKCMEIKKKLEYPQRNFKKKCTQEISAECYFKKKKKRNTF